MKIVSIKFSYLNEDLENLSIDIPKDLDSLDAILEFIEKKLEIKAEKLNDRYYTLSKDNLVDLCGTVLDNFAENSIPGSTVEILGTKVAQITDVDGKFMLQGVPKDASLRIRYLGYLTKIMSVADVLVMGDCPKILMSPHIIPTPQL